MTTVVEKTWTIGATQTISSPTIKSFLDDVATWIAANAVHWSVVDNDAVFANGRQILLESSDADIADHKVCLFGGETPSSGARYSGVVSSSTALYVASDSDHASDTFDADFTAGAPLTGGNYAGGVYAGIVGTLSYHTRWAFLEKGDAFILTSWHDATGDTIAIFGGVWGRDDTDQQLYGHMGIGNTSWSGNGWEHSSTHIFPPGPGATSGSSASAVAWIDGTAKKFYRLYATIDSAHLETMSDPTSTTYYTLDIPAVDADGYIRGYFAQMRIGKDDTHLNQRTNDNGQEWITISEDPSTANNALWLKQPSP
jgi:hypothetical protein